jgi:hypothetical protein
MANFWSKQPSSRPIRYQVLAYAGGGSSVGSTNFQQGCTQIRVVSEVQGWLVIGDGNAVSRTAQSSSMKINANTDEEYFTVTGGTQMAAFNSTSTSSGMISISECA